MMHGSTVTYSVQPCRYLPPRVDAAAVSALHLGMGRRIGERLDQIMAASHDRAVGHDHRADGHFLQL